MTKIRVLGACAAIGGVALLTGCVGVPADPYYGGGYSSGPYYSEPAPVVVPAPVYINGGGYYERRPRYYDRPYYDRPAYPVRPPAWGGGRPVPPAAVPALPPPIKLPPGSIPTPPRGNGNGNASPFTPPDWRNQGAP